MPVDTKHAKYTEFTPVWEKMRDTIAGEDAVKERDEIGAGEYRTGRSNLQPKSRTRGGRGATSRRYLPQLKHTDDDYRAYKMRARFFGATGRTLDAIVGAAFRKPPIPVAPTAVEQYIEEIGDDGVPFSTIARDTLREMAGAGRTAILVDMPTEDVEVSERRPYWIQFRTEQILNWRYATRAGKPILSLVTIMQEVEAQGTDEYDTGCRNVIRVLRLDESGYYVHEVWGQVEGGEWELESVAEPDIRGQRMAFLPIQIFTATTLNATPERSPLDALANANLSHYRLSADMMHALHKSAIPWLVIPGGDPEKETIEIGAEMGTILPQGATAQYVEFSGAGVAAIRDEMDRIRDEMALLGANVIRAQKREAETAEAMRLASSGEQSVLATMVDVLERGLTQCLQWTAEWIGESTDGIAAGLSRDFASQQMTAAEAEGWMRTQQGGAISEEDLYAILKRGEALGHEVTLEEYKARLEVERERSAAAGLAAFGTPPPDDTEDDGQDAAA